MRGNTSGRGRDGRGNDVGQRNASSASATTNEPTAQNATNANDHQSVVSEMTERGSQIGRSFGRGAYT